MGAKNIRNWANDLILIVSLVENIDFIFSSIGSIIITTAISSFY